MKLIEFLERDPSAELVDKIIQHTSFQEMKNNPCTNYSMFPEIMMDLKVSPFMRKGEKTESCDFPLKGLSCHD